MDSIPFPFEPYEEQKKLMSHIYRTLDEGSIALLESPTGTGKSMSIICSSLHWLLTHQNHQHHHQHHHHHNNNTDSSTTPHWVNQFFEQQQKDMKAKQLEQKRELLRKHQQNLYGHHTDTNNDEPAHKRLKLSKQQTDDDSAYLVEESKCNAVHERTANDWIKALNKELKSEQDVPAVEDDSKRAERRTPQIIYCSRTHSQLAQFVQEIKRTVFADQDIEVVTVGSRKQLCIHPKISKYASVSKMNDACLNLKDNKKNKKIKNEIEKIKKKKRTFSVMRDKENDDEADMLRDGDIDNRSCAYNCGKDKLDAFAAQLTSAIHDIEECHTMGTQYGICPYYGIRGALSTAHLILMPYTSLIHEKTRKSLDIEIKDNVIVIDEAHNLIENINQIHSVQITVAKLKLAAYQLNQYKTKYINRLKHKNITKIKLLLKVITNFIQYLSAPLASSESQSQSEQPQPQQFVVKVNDLLFALKLDHINFYDLIQYIESAELIRKLSGFLDKQLLSDMKTASKNEKNPTVIRHHNNASVLHSPLQFVVNILAAFTAMDSDGRLIVTKHGSSSQQHVNKNALKYIQLNPFVHFARIVKESRAVILCGGTMQPMTHFVQQLFPPQHICKSVSILQCDHVVSSDRVLAVTVPYGPCKQKMDFTFAHRFNEAMIDDLGAAIVNFTKRVHAGNVVFFPSFKYMQFVLSAWKKSKCNVYERLSANKRLLVEPESSKQVDAVLDAYNKAVYPAATTTAESDERDGSGGGGGGAILFCVVGGKMSEGINFKDDLARTVIMVGLPYPNPNDVELKERMKHLSQSIDSNAGNVYYNNLCMRAVNQSIGRAIRHKFDYGAIILIDHRYSERANVRQSIPNWIQRSFIKCESFQAAFQSFCKFIKRMKTLSNDTN